MSVRAFAVVAALLVACAGPLAAQSPPAEALPIFDLRPAEGEFVLDLASMLTPADKTTIQQIASQLLADKGTPIIVVTIDSIAQQAGAGMPIEAFAHMLFDRWGIGTPATAGDKGSTGMLLLVSKTDRKARIELGGYWRHDQDLESRRIMDQAIIPRFKAGDFSGGIVAGVARLEQLARGQAPLPVPQQTPARQIPMPLPTHVSHEPPRSHRAPMALAGFVCIAAFVAIAVLCALIAYALRRVISLAGNSVGGAGSTALGASSRRRRRRKHRSGLGGAAAGGMLGAGFPSVLPTDFSGGSTGFSSDSSGFSSGSTGPSSDTSGGSFGGGTSDGGGATGSW